MSWHVDGVEPRQKAYSSSHTLTARVVAATGPGAHPRLAEIMPSLLHHLHGFAREVQLTQEEWMAAVDLINKAGQMSDSRRNETQLLCDVLGLESLLDEINCPRGESPYRPYAEPTPSAILGPFHRHAAPILDHGDSIVSPALLAVSAAYRERLTHMTGRVTATDGRILPGVVLDVWHAAPNGKYEQQDVMQPDMHLRGRFVTGFDGTYSLYCLRPPPYPIPDDGPAGHLLKLLDRHPYRPSHIHFTVSGHGCFPLTTQIFDEEDPYMANDSVFAAKRDLAVRFVPIEDDERGARWRTSFDFVLQYDP